MLGRKAVLHIEYGVVCLAANEAAELVVAAVSWHYETAAMKIYKYWSRLLSIFVYA